jgi:hypothetical protein
MYWYRILYEGAPPAGSSSTNGAAKVESKAKATKAKDEEDEENDEEDEKPVKKKKAAPKAKAKSTRMCYHMTT